ncbi:MAG TPA: asparagine synthetase B family protein [Bryobacteraceae bacterium]|nr:asparagine synthetase B family protein [Bryobacteraceae bacterium]
MLTQAASDWTRIPYLSLRREGNSLRIAGALTWETTPPYLGWREPFVGWRFTGATLSFQADPLGIYPLFYCCTNGRLSISPSLQRVVSECGATELDYEALSVFLRLGYYVGSDTPFKDVKQLDPGASGRIENGTLTLSSRQLVPVLFDGSRSAAICAYRDLFRQAMARVLDAAGDFVLPLSGGRDSRHILLEAAHLGSPPRLSVTGGKAASALPFEDIRVASLLTSRLGIRHRTVPPGLGRLEDLVANFHLTNFCAGESQWFRPIASVLLEEQSTVLDGLGGDMLSAGLFQTRKHHALFKKDIPRLARALLGDGVKAKIKARLLTHALGPDLGRLSSLEVARARLTRELVRHREAINPLQSFYFFNRTRRGMALAPCAILWPLRVVCPYLDRDLFQFLCGLPPAFVLGRRFHDDTISTAFPAMQDIPFERKGGRGPKALPGWPALRADMAGYFGSAAGIESVDPQAARQLAGWMARLEGPAGYHLQPILEKLVYLMELERMPREGPSKVTEPRRVPQVPVAA